MSTFDSKAKATLLVNSSLVEIQKNECMKDLCSCIKLTQLTVGGRKQIFKPRFTKLVKVRYHGFVVRIILSFFHSVQFPELKVQFRHLLPEVGVPQLLKDVVSKDHNECCRCL